MANIPTVTSKPLGYNKLAGLMAQNTEAAIFRRFGSLNMITILYMQAELMELERNFEVECLGDSASQVDSVNSFCRDFTKLRASAGTPNDDQLRSLKLIQTKLEQYSIQDSWPSDGELKLTGLIDNALVLASGVVNLNKPETKEIERLRTWIGRSDLGGDFLVDTEALTWDAKYKGDFVVLSSPSPDNESLFPNLSSLPVDFLHRCFQRKRNRVPDDETGVFVYDDVYIRRFNKFVVTIVASLLPIVAIIVLYAVKGTWRRIYVTIAFTALFGIAMACTSARKSEIFAATAAFAAVEVVFIGSVSGT